MKPRHLTLIQNPHKQAAAAAAQQNAND